MSATPSSVKKRKPDSGPFFTIDSLHIKPHASSPFDTAVRITPTVLIPRSHIPIQWLAGAPSRVFALPANLEPLSLPGHVAVVKMEGERQLSAVERLADGIYVLYRLSPHIRLGEVRKLAMQLKKENIPQGFVPNILGEEPWWKGAGCEAFPHSELECSPSLNDVSETIPDAITPDLSRSATPHTQREVHTMAAPATAVASDEEKSMDDVCDNLRHQYYEALYLAKTSLAFFAKSALSRARAAARQKAEESTESAPLEQLTASLQEMLVPLDKMDQKFRKTLIRAVTEETIDDKTVMRKDEETYVNNWRVASFGDRFIKDGDENLKKLVEELKTRETELQVILLLEILALNKDKPSAKEPEKKSKKKKQPKKKKGMADPETLLDLLIDRLSIWHSIGSELKGDAPVEETEKVAEKDHLRHFCVEVVMAFYASKLPEICASINKKFGGHVGTSKRPERRRAQASTAKKAAKPPPLRTTPSFGTISESGKAEPLSAIALEAAGPKSSRGGTLNSKSFSKRVFQFDSKKPVSKKVDEELRSAIEALKKPNRLAVSSEVVEEHERRLSTARTGRKQLKPKRVTSSNVLVTATPRKRKTLSTMDGEPNQQLHNGILEDDTSVVKRTRRDPFARTVSSDGTGAPPVLATPPRHRPAIAFDSPVGGVNLFAQRTPVRSRPVPSVVQSTPLGKTTGIVASTPLGVPSTPNNKVSSAYVEATPVGPSGAFLSVTPVKRTGASVIEATPPRKTNSLYVETTPMGDCVAATPVKSPPLRPPPFPAKSAKKVDAEVDIYTALGWNDDL